MISRLGLGKYPVAAHLFFVFFLYFVTNTLEDFPVLFKIFRGFTLRNVETKFPCHVEADKSVPNARGGRQGPQWMKIYSRSRQHKGQANMMKHQGNTGTGMLYCRITDTLQMTRQ